MARTDKIAVQSMLGRNYDGKSDLNQWIAQATAVVDRVVAAALAVKSITLSTQEQLNIETPLACHFYTMYDPLYASKSTGGASGTWVADPKCPERYRKLAQDADYSGMLTAVLARQTAGGKYLGASRRRAGNRLTG